MQKDFDACKAKAGGCLTRRQAHIAKVFELSNANIDAVNNCIAKGDAACVTRLESQAASASEVDNAIPFGYGSISTVFQGRQNNINKLWLHQG